MQNSFDIMSKTLIYWVVEIATEVSMLTNLAQPVRPLCALRGDIKNSSGLRRWPLMPDRCWADDVQWRLTSLSLFSHLCIKVLLWAPASHLWSIFPFIKLASFSLSRPWSLEAAESSSVAHSPSVHLGSVAYAPATTSIHQHFPSSPVILSQLRTTSCMANWASKWLQ